ncbi:WbqC-like family protein [Parvibaculum lavamentivorans DS-1]|uniref:WbqC-like family protein n=1 Tax=Parvibaculum lavamentivorans (strain DS-1 / DSM 13023 / NCIMB 13966) TaxID=402881 RepID=A7HYD3_PARL1|nr:WbqC family protein [Parvibaculum lavamentivorans]ABS64916.1 WbqC-like family protein [Parvibaculum lavamentivorans DS-1]
MKKVAILQSNYIPWKGYFDLIASVDEFILYDDMQYTRRDWRNRNQIKTPQGLMWLTVPVKVKGKYHQKICETEIDGVDWPEGHWKSISSNYKRAPFFAEVTEWLSPFYLEKRYSHLSILNRDLLEAICRYLGVCTTITNSSDYELVQGQTERLASLCEQAGASEYISGPAAREYLDEEVFRRKGIGVTWFDYSGYPEYPQLWGDFVHTVSIVDLLFNCGSSAGQYMKAAGRR